MEEEEENLMTSPEIVKFLNISRGTLTKLINEGLPCIKVGNDYRFSKSQVFEHLKIQAQGEIFNAS